MTAAENRELSYFPAGLDTAVNERFGPEVQCKTEYGFIDVRHTTIFIAEGDLRVRIEEFVAGYIAGNKELSDRIFAVHHSKK